MHVMHCHDLGDGEQQRPKQLDGRDAFEQAAKDNEGDDRHDHKASVPTGHGLHELSQLSRESRLGQAQAISDALPVMSRMAPATRHLIPTPCKGLVNSAGFGWDVGFKDTDSALLRATFEVNVLAAFSISREAALLMRAHKQGAIVHISSVSGLVGNRGRAAYGITKAGLINLTQVMANELAQEGIRVNCVCPGPIMTPLAMQVHTEQVQETWKSAVPMHRYGTPREVAQAICFLLDTEKTAYMTGQIISVDGGFVNTGLLA